MSHYRAIAIFDHRWYTVQPWLTEMAERDGSTFNCRRDDYPPRRGDFEATGTEYLSGREIGSIGKAILPHDWHIRPQPLAEIWTPSDLSRQFNERWIKLGR